MIKNMSQIILAGLMKIADNKPFVLPKINI